MDPFFDLCSRLVAEFPDKTFAEFCQTIELRHSIPMAPPERRAALERAMAGNGRDADEEVNDQIGREQADDSKNGHAQASSEIPMEAKKTPGQGPEGKGEKNNNEAHGSANARERTAKSNGADHEIDDTDADLAVFDHEPELEAAKAPPSAAIARAQAESDAIRDGADEHGGALPDALRPLAEQTRWVVWRWEKNQKGKPTKVPYQPHGKDRKASSTDPKTWSSFASVWAAREKFDGVGFCLLNSGYGAFDLDDCRDATTGAIAPWAKELVARAGSYTEITISNTGLRIIGHAGGPKIHRKQPVTNGSTLETYRRAERYVVMTGDVLPGTPQVLANINSVMEEVVAELDGKKQSKANGHGGDKDDLPPKLVSMLCVEGSGGYQSRSDLLLAFLCEALRKRVNTEVIADACLDQKYRGFGIFEHCRENGGREYVLRQIERALSKVESDLEYEARADGTYWRKRTESGSVWIKLANFSAKVVSGSVWIKLANFSAKVVEDVVVDDGSVEEQRVFVIEGSPGRAHVSADSFNSARWVTRSFGARACVAPGQGTGQRFLDAVKKLGADELLERRVFAHTGWRKISGAWTFLHAGCGGGVEVRLDGALAHYVLPAVTDVRAAVLASLRMLDLAPARVAYPLFGAVYRAPLGEWAPITASLFLHGKTGGRKTAVAMIVQAHFAPGLDAPAANWEATANALERTAFLAKDVGLVVDDYVLKDGASALDRARLHHAAERLVRGNANRGGRGRLTADLRARPEWYSRAMLTITGEDLPVGHSLRARTMMVEIGGDDVDLEVLTEMQERRGMLAEATAGYVAWLADRDKAAFGPRQIELRGNAIKELKTAHGRTAENVAVFQIGVETALRFAVDVGALSEQEAEEHVKKSWDVLIALAKEQALLLQSQNPAERFLNLIGAAISSGRAHVASSTHDQAPEKPEAMGWQVVALGSGGEPIWRGQGRRIGWVKDNLIYLEQEAAYAEAQSLASAQHGALAMTKETLWKRLFDAGKIAVHDEGKNTQRLSTAQGRKRTICLHLAEVVDVSDPDQSKAAAPEQEDLPF